MRRLLLLLAVCAAGCSSTADFPADTPWARMEWMQFGRNSARTQQAAAGLRAPLTEAWTRDLEGGQGPGSPLAAGGSLFVPAINGSIGVFDLATGEERGEITARGWLKATPVIIDSVLIYPSASAGLSLHALHLPTMRELWENEVGMIETPLLAAGGRVVAGTANGDLFCVAARDSTVLWRLHARKAIAGPVAVSENRVFYTTAGGDLAACGLVDGVALWRKASGAPFASGPVAGPGCVLAVDRNGAVHCLAAADGAVRWTRDLGAMVYASPAADDTAAYIAAADGALTALSLRDGRTLWAARFSTVLASSPVLAGPSVVCVALNGHVALLDAHTGAIQWETDLGTRVKTSPIIAGGLLILCTESRRVIAFRSEAP
jgi:eukaryotic-like serine/threonine-protein kinase